MTNSLDHEGTKSLKHTQTDRELAEELGIEGHGVGPQWSESMRIRAAFQELQAEADRLKQGLENENRDVTIGDLTALVHRVAAVDADYEEDDMR